MIEKTVSIGSLKEMLQDYDVEIDSPDGWVPVLEFVDKGEWDEYVLEVNNKKIRVNENHLFETSTGWMSAKEIFLFQNVLGKFFDGLHFKCDDGRLHQGYIIQTGKKIPIVDIQIGHENQRYYSDGVSSHNTAVGKSLAMCHLAAAALAQGRNVLYITMEMSEEKIAERIDANLFNVNIDQIVNLSNENFHKKVKGIADKTHGKLIIKEYPTGAAHTGHFRALLQELKLKKNFVPDMIFIDYLNICASSRVKGGVSGAGGTYSLIKSIAEEIRGLAVEFNVPIWSATQVTRTGFCLDLNTLIETKTGKKPISEVSVGDQLKSNEGFNDVVNIFPLIRKKAYRITLESGKTIICSKDHKFPVNGVDTSINSGMKIGDKLVTSN